MSKLTDYKALLFDIDGTLITKDRVITDEIVNNLKQLVDLGYKIGICSGRGYATIVSKIIPLFPKDAIHILAGGSQLINSNGNIIWDSPIDPAVVQEIRDFLSTSESIATFAKADAQYATGKLLKYMQDHPWNFITKDLSEMTNDHVGLIYIAELNKETESLIKNHPKLSHKHMINNSGNEYLDVTAKGVNKSGAVKKFAKQLNIAPNEIIGFGDSLNDIEFLETCGFAVAMGNGMNEVKEIADVTIGPVNENGLATYLSKIIKGETL